MTDDLEYYRAYLQSLKVGDRVWMAWVPANPYIPDGPAEVSEISEKVVYVRQAQGSAWSIRKSGLGVGAAAKLERRERKVLSPLPPGAA